jgi:type IV pilus assembly protein PilO
MIKDLASQFKGLNTNDPGVWPIAPKAALLGFIFATVVGMAYFLDWKSGFEELNVGAEKELTLKEEYKQKKAKAVNLDLYRKKLADIDAAFGTLLRQLPDRSEVDRLVVDINQAGVSQGLQFELFKPALEETKMDFYAELPINIKVSGEYHRLGLFASDIAQLSRIVTLNDMNISKTKEGVLTFEAVAKTFRYLDDTEVNEQKKLAAEAKKKAGGK